MRDFSIRRMIESVEKPALLLLCGLLAAGAAVAADYPIRNAEMSAVRVTHGFWFDRLETNRTATLESNWRKCHETPRIANFTNAANRAIGTFGGIPFDDSDVYKVMEGTAYILATHPDPRLQGYQNWLVGEIAKAQEPDGYLYTARTLGFDKLNADLDKLDKSRRWCVKMMGPTRWSNTGSSHELYNNGHMIEAAVAWHETTGNDNFLKVARKAADLFDRTFGPGETQLKCIPGHEEIELALVRLFRATGERRYLNLAKFFLETRGKGTQLIDGVPCGEDGTPLPQEGYGRMNLQDHLPVVQQREAKGHAVRAGYLYCGMADVAALTGEKAYLEAISAIWENVVSRKLHLTGGVGARRTGEAFGADYELPNESAYLETCAAIANALWNDRMFRFKGETRYVDVLERTIYNGFASGISLSGDEYFYPNPLASKGGYKRSKWFGCSCCPVNGIRFIPQIPSFALATDGRGTVYWNLFLALEAEIDGVKLSVETDYPWDGKVKLTVKSLALRPGGFSTLKVRIPGWAVGRPVPSGLYEQTEPSSFMEVGLAVNGLALNGCPGRDGYVAITRAWKAGDMVTLNLPMPVKRIRAHEKVEADRGRLAVEKGPIVYCAEGVDNGGKAFEAALPPGVTFTEDSITIGDKRYPALKASNGLKLIPYCLWGNRQPGNELQVWFK